jgi:formate-dependent nitrite reductase membrane component NrfD
MTVVMTGGTNRIVPPIPPPEYGDYMNPAIMNDIIGTLMWLIGLGGMVVIPMMVYAKAKEKGEPTGRFNGSVVLIGIFIICMALFFWAIS